MGLTGRGMRKSHLIHRALFLCLVTLAACDSSTKGKQETPAPGAAPEQVTLASISGSDWIAMADVFGLLRSHDIKFAPAEGSSRGWRLYVAKDDYERGRSLLMEDAKKKGTYWIWFDKDTIILPRTDAWDERPGVDYEEALALKNYSQHTTMGTALRRDQTKSAAREFPVLLRVASRRIRTASQDQEELVEIQLGDKQGKASRIVRYRIRQVNDDGSLKNRWESVE